MNEAEKIKHEARKISEPYDNKKVILVVEDDRTHRTLMDTILKACAFYTVQAENGIVALSKIEAGEHFDLILMDWDMPELDGLETVKAIRAQEIQSGKPHTPVIAFTSNRQPGDREKCLAAGMDAYLPKDVWMPRWRDTLIDNLQGLICGEFELSDFDEAVPPPPKPKERNQLDHFDLQALEQCVSLLKNEFPIAVDEYLEDAAAYIRDIKDGLKNGNAEKAARGSHPLKSNSKGFGLMAVSQLAEAINTITRAGSLDGVEALLSQLEDAFSLAEKKLRETIKTLVR